MLKIGHFDLAKSTPTEYFIGAEPYEEYVARFIQGINQALELRGPVYSLFLMEESFGLYASICIFTLKTFQMHPLYNSYHKQTPGF